LRLRIVERLRFLAGTWPFGVVEAIWAVIALKRYRSKPTVHVHPTEN